MTRRLGKTWEVSIDDDRAYPIENVAEVEVQENGALLLMDPSGVWLAVFAPGAWRTALPVEEA